MDSIISDLIPAKEAALILGVSTPVVYQLCKCRSTYFPAFRVGNKYLVSKSGLDQWIADQLTDRTEIEL